MPEIIKGQIVRNYEAKISNMVKQYIQLIEPFNYETAEQRNLTQEVENAEINNDQDNNMRFTTNEIIDNVKILLKQILLSHSEFDKVIKNRFHQTKSGKSRRVSFLNLVEVKRLSNQKINKKPKKKKHKKDEIDEDEDEDIMDI